MIPLRIDGISAGYDGKTVIADVTLTVPAGALCCLLGPSGCGKTTLLRTIAGFVKPQRGQIFFGERNVTRLPTEARGLGMVFQHYCLWPHRDVAGNVSFPLEMAKVPAHERAPRIAAALTAVALPGHESRTVGLLSGGQQQRVAIARALVARPPLLLLDEPLSNLDAKLRHELRDEIRRLCKSTGVTAVCVTHDQAEALAMADLLAVMVDGRLAQIGTPRDCYERPTSVAVATFLGDANVLTGQADQGVINLGPLGSIPAPRTHSGAVSVCIRPERLRLLDATTPAPAEALRWNGTVREAIYEGASTRLRLQVQDHAILARVACAPDIRLDQTLTVWCNPADVVIIPT